VHLNYDLQSHLNSTFRILARDSTSLRYFNVQEWKRSSSICRASRQFMAILFSINGNKLAAGHTDSGQINLVLKGRPRMGGSRAFSPTRNGAWIRAALVTITATWLQFYDHICAGVRSVVGSTAKAVILPRTPALLLSIQVAHRHYRPSNGRHVHRCCHQQRSRGWFL
jgi:hypothetical protein